MGSGWGDWKRGPAKAAWSNVPKTGSKPVIGKGKLSSPSKYMLIGYRTPEALLVELAGGRLTATEVLDLAGLDVVDERTVRFRFKKKDRQMPLVVGGLPVFSPKWGMENGKPKQVGMRPEQRKGIEERQRSIRSRDSQLRRRRQRHRCGWKITK